MCPVCLATAAILAGSATGTGGLTALVARQFWKRESKDQFPTIKPKENHDGYQPDRSASPQNRPPR
jgi:hypothetical protein